MILTIYLIGAVSVFIGSMLSFLRDSKILTIRDIIISIIISLFSWIIWVIMIVTWCKNGAWLEIPIIDLRDKNESTKNTSM